MTVLGARSHFLANSWLTKGTSRVQAGGSMPRQLAPDVDRAQEVDLVGQDPRVVEDEVWLTMHRECPWALDPADAAHGHAIEDAQGGGPWLCSGS